MNEEAQKRFIERAREIHGDRYSYVKCVYERSTSKVIIVCPKHGEFLVSPNTHTSMKSGCPTCGKEQRKRTNLERYGTENVRSVSKFKEKAVQTNLERYGHTSPSKSPEVREKTKATNMKRYGGPAPTCSSQVLGKRDAANLEKYGYRHPMSVPEIRQRVQQTNLERYGHKNPSSSPEVGERRKQTNLERYGATTPLIVPEIAERVKQSHLAKYGVDHPGKAPEVQLKAQQTNLERYGHKNPSSSPDVKKKRASTFLMKYGTPILSRRTSPETFEQLGQRSWLYDQYHTLGKTQQQIAEEVNVGDSTVSRYMATLSIPVKASRPYSRKAIIWLESIAKEHNIHIQHAENGGEFLIPGTRYRADGYCAETKTVYEFYGDYWHGNPDKYAPTVLNVSVGRTMGELYCETATRRRTLEELGYQVVWTWESDIG